ncbi:putative MFS transporter [Geopyxis carbonaria]|nr:putative MFS transporter [Geopyxis carbonaria]
METPEANNQAMDISLESEPPGTELLSSHEHLVLVPHPSTDPADPLTWTPWWKRIMMAHMILVAFTHAFGPISIAPQVPFYMMEWDRSLHDVLQFTGVCILVLGFSNFFWVPMSSAIGRRPAIILSGAVSLIACVLRATSTSYGAFMGAAVLHGFGAGTAETLPPVLIADVMFLHERGVWMNIYTWVYFGGLMLGPIVAGAISDRFGWRSFWWLNVALYAVAFVFQLFTCPETRFDRKHIVPTNDTSSSSDETPEKIPTAVQLEDASASNPQLHSGRPTARQFWSLMAHASTQPFKAIGSSFLTPWYLFSFPIVQWASFTFSWSASAFLIVNLTQSQVFAAPPYLMSASAVGLTNFAPFVGCTIGMVTAGPFSDWVSMKLTMRNRGIREPEMRLVALVPYVVATLIGGLVMAYGYQNLWRWEIIVLVGYTLLGMQCSAVSAIAMTYAIDSYKPVAGEILVAATVNKNLWGYGVSVFLTGWIITDGFVPGLMTIIGTMIFICMIAVPLWFCGKTLRRWTGKSWVHSAEET